VTEVYLHINAQKLITLGFKYSELFSSNIGAKIISESSLSSGNLIIASMFNSPA
jgi:hypothetical protein